MYRSQPASGFLLVLQTSGNLVQQTAMFTKGLGYRRVFDLFRLAVLGLPWLGLCLKLVKATEACRAIGSTSRYWELLKASL